MHYFETLLIPHWHLVLVCLLLLWMAVFYWIRFVRPAQQLRVLLDRVNQQLDPDLPQNAPALLKLQDIEREVMTDAGLRHLWRQYAHTLHARWMPSDAGPLGVARSRVSALSKSFFAEMNAAAHGERIDLSDIEQFTQSDPHMADLWARYNEALQEQQALEASQQNQTGGWQATASAEQRLLLYCIRLSLCSNDSASALLASSRCIVYSASARASGERLSRAEAFVCIRLSLC